MYEEEVGGGRLRSAGGAGSGAVAAGRATVTFRGVADSNGVAVASSPSGTSATTRTTGGVKRGGKTSALSNKLSAQKQSSGVATTSEGDWLEQQQAELASHLESMGLNAIIGDLETTRGHQRLPHNPLNQQAPQQQQRGGPTLLPLSEVTAAPATHNPSTSPAAGSTAYHHGGGDAATGPATPHQLRQTPHGAASGLTRGGLSTSTTGFSGGDASVIIGSSMAQLQQQVASLSMQLRVAQGENREMQLELDRCDASRLQALDDVERLQHQVTMLSENVSELRHVAVQAREAAAAGAHATSQLRAARAELAERDAEVAHLKGRVAELQRATSQLPESQLAADAARIRAELAARMGGGGGAGRTPQPLSSSTPADGDADAFATPQPHQ
jgi:hypothetical protein